MKTITTLILCLMAMNAMAQIESMFSNIQPIEQYNLNKTKIDSVSKTIAIIKTGFEGEYQKINHNEKMIIDSNTITVNKVFYPHLNDPYAALMSSRDIRFDNAQNTTTTYRFSLFENDSLNVFSKESSFSMSYPNIYGSKPKWDNGPTLSAFYYYAFQKMILERITDKIIIFNNEYYIKL